MVDVGRSGSPGTARGRRWPLRDRPSMMWFAAAFVVTLIHPFLPASRWLMVHMVALGAISHSIMVWSAHFTRTLVKTRLPDNDRKLQSARLLMLQAGAVLAMIGVPTTWWWLTLAAGILVATAVIWHGISLYAILRRALPARFVVTVHYYLVAAAYLAVGVTFGVILASGLSDRWHGRVLVAHTMANLLGWVGLSVTGTVLTLWPTVLRTRMDEAGVKLSRRTLPLLVVAAAVVITGALFGWRWVSVAGLSGYLAGLVVLAKPMWVAVRRRTPHTFSAWSMGAGYLWLLVGLVIVIVTVATLPGWAAVAQAYAPITAVLVVGFALQTLLGALSHLLPVALGGGPVVLKSSLAEIERGATLRVGLVNLGLVTWLLPTSSVVKVVASSLALLGLAATLPLLLRGVYAGVRTLRALRAGKQPAAPEERSARPAGFAVAAAVVALAVALAGAITPGERTQATTAVRATGVTTTVQVEARGMRFIPATITVNPGDRLIIEVTNSDPGQVHDLVLANGANSGRLGPGQRARVDAGVIGESTDGWCSIVGHRQMGMVLTIQAGDASAQQPAAPAAGDHAGHDMARPAAPAGPDLGRSPATDFRAAPAELAPLGPERVHKETFVVREELAEVAPGVRQVRWTFNGKTPGPTLHGRIGDRFEITLINRGTMGHSIDFHASEIAPNVAMRTIAPGESLTYAFTANRAGIWLYHCSTSPMSAHISAGMHGAVVIEPDSLPQVDRSYLMVQSELYLGADATPVDAAKVATQNPDAVVFNGYADQYHHRPLPARVGERIRFWVLDAGPNKPSAFHIVGAQFDTVYAEGAYHLRQSRDAFGNTGGGSQVLGLQAAQGGFVETTFVEPGRYPVVTHVMSDAEKGAHGLVEVAR